MTCRLTRTRRRLKNRSKHSRSKRSDSRNKTRSAKYIKNWRGITRRRVLRGGLVYDDEFDNIKRMKKLILEIKRLDNNKEEIKKIYPSLKERMELNKIKLFNILKNKDDENFIKNMCNE